VEYEKDRECDREEKEKERVRQEREFNHRAFE
jgi:hypothetical protein